MIWENSDYITSIIIIYDKSLFNFVKSLINYLSFIIQCYLKNLPFIIFYWSSKDIKGSAY